MSKKNRTVLRNYFRSGQMPTEEHFQNLIDSSLNLVEEGFDRSPESGFKISTMGAQDNLFSFYKYSDSQSALWNVRFAGKGGDSVEWVSSDELARESNPATNQDSEGRDSQNARPTLVLNQKGRVGVGRHAPRSALDVAGFFRSEGRVGGVSTLGDASAQWQPITEPLEGCHGFEVTAGAGGAKGAGKYALLHAVALKAYSRKGWFAERFDRYKGISITQSCYRNRHNRLRLSWRPAVDQQGQPVQGNKYQLFIKTNCPYGEGDDYKIQVHLTRLWDDPDMSASRKTTELVSLL